MTDSDLSSFVSAILGAIVGGVFVLIAQYLQHQSEKKAAGRGLLAEMMNNANLALRGVMSAPATYPEHFSSQVWTGQLPLVAQLLTWAEVDKIRDAYDIQFSVLENASLAAKATAEGKHGQAANSMFENFGTLADRLVEAMRPLADAVLENEDHREIGRQIRKLKCDVKSQLETSRMLNS
jgi:hypothetical protein